MRNVNGVALTVLFSVWSAYAAVRYVDVNSANPTPPYTNWATAANVIQDAVDVAVAGDEIVVANGIYATGGKALSGDNRVAVDRPVLVRSVNGPELTIIRGYQVPANTNGDGAIRCVYLTNGASLSGFTLTNGATPGWGGGVFCQGSSSMVSNCVIVGNSAAGIGGGAFFGNKSGQMRNSMLEGNTADSGGAVAGGSHYNCRMIGNSAREGGAAFLSELYNCAVTGNSASESGGGIQGTIGNQSIVYNCIVYFNSAPTGANYYRITAYYSCMSPQPTNGTGNISDDPLFVDYDGGNLRLQSNSPCVNAGNNDYSSGGTDLDGNPRIAGGQLDIGAYEFPFPPLPPIEPIKHYVNVNNLNPVPPYLTWSTAAQTIQDAVDVALDGEEVVVTNGVYATGGRVVGTNLLVNRVAVDKPLMVRSVNGPEVTVIQGYQVPGTTNGDSAIRCVYLSAGANLSGFSLKGGATRAPFVYSWEEDDSNGGGVLCESATSVVSNCVLEANSAYRVGGGVFGGTLENCTLAKNSASAGGGAASSVL